MSICSLRGVEQRFTAQSAMGLAVLMAVCLSVSLSKVLGSATDVVVRGVFTGNGMDFGHLGRILAFACALLAGAWVLQYGMAYILAGAVQRTMYRLRADVEEKLNRLPLSYVDRAQRGDLLSRVTNDIDNIAQSLQQTMSQMLTSVLLLSRLIAGFLEHVGRMSASQAAGAIRTAACHRGNVVRYLARLGVSRDWQVLEQVAALLLEMESRRSGRWLFIVDQTYNGQSGARTENTFSRANYRPRAKHSQRRQKKAARRSCHGFVMGLLLTPSGYRIPSCRCYYSREYCRATGRTYRTQTEWAAELIRQVPIPKTGISAPEGILQERIRNFRD